MKMRMRIAFLFLFVCILGSCSKESLDNANIAEAKNAIEVENELLNTVNSHRVALGYTSLNFSAVAYEYANDHTDYMISQGGLSHDNFSSRASNIKAKKTWVEKERCRILSIFYWLLCSVNNRGE